MRGGLPDGRSDRLLEPLRVPVQQFPGLPEDGRLARRLLRDLQHVQRGGDGLPRRAGLRLRPDEDAGGAGGDAAVLQHQHDLRRPPPGRPGRLAPAAGRLMFRLAYRNYSDHEAVVANHSVTSGSSVGVRWYEIRSPSTTPTLFQSGTYAPTSDFRWMGSIAMDQSGNVGLGFSVSSSSLHPQVHYTGRLAGDAVGTMAQGEGSIID